MKNLSILSLLVAILFSVSLGAQEELDSTGFAGDHFSLEGSLELFKQSNSLEEFEKKLNKEDNYVNNLDLNEDGQIDYIKVMDNMDGDVHAIVLQVDVSDKETQDIAVILIEKTASESAMLQIVGDEDVYGEEKIVEPFGATMDAGGKGMVNGEFGRARIVVNVWTWPSVRFVYSPTYVVYRSPWRWSYYPNWWKPWRPHPYRWHYSKRTVYHVHYKPYHSHRVVKAHSFYKPKRKSSVTVRSKTVTTRTVVKKGKKGPAIKSTSVKKETKVTRKNNGRKVQSTTSRKSKTTVKGKKGKVSKTQKSKVKRKK